MRTLFFIPAWQRREITEICYRSLQRVIATSPPEIGCEVLTVVSDKKDERLARKYDFHTFSTPNEPLGKKFNAGMEYALNEYEFDYVFQLNSDDVLSTDIWRAFLPYFQKKRPFFGLETLYFYDLPTGRMKRYHYFDGCGIRVISRTAIEKAGWCKYGRAKQSMSAVWVRIGSGETGYFPEGKVNGRLIEELNPKRVFHLWPPEAAKGLDSWSRNRIFWTNGINTLRFPPEDEWPEPLVVDIKSDANIWQYDDCPDGKDMEPGAKAKALRKFPELEAAILKSAL